MLGIKYLYFMVSYNLILFHNFYFRNQDALKCENGRKICGQPIIIEWSKTKPWNKSSSKMSRHVLKNFYNFAKFCF